MAEAYNTNSSQFEFSGRGGEYFKIWIVNILLTLLTLGIYSAWATVRKRRYFYGNTSLDGNAFEYLATPWMILKGRLVAVAALIIYSLVSHFYPLAALALLLLLALAAPWIIWNSIRFNTRMSAYRNVRFSFYGKIGPVYFNILMLPLIPLLITAVLGFVLYFTGLVSEQKIALLTIPGILAFYLILPLVQARMAGYFINHAAFGQGKFTAEIGAGTYYTTYLKAFLITIGFLIAFVAIAALASMAGAISSMGNMQPGQMPQGPIVAIMILAYVLMVSIFIWIGAFVAVRIRNYLFDSTSLDRNFQLQSTMATAGLFKVYLTNTLIVILTLGLGFPWAAVRLARYKAEQTSAEVAGDLSGYVTQQQSYQSALGDELGDAFDLGMDIAL